MSSSLDAKTIYDLKSRAAADDPARRAHLELTGALHAGSWLNSIPSKANKTHIDPSLFRSSVLRWIRIPLTPDDTVCPLCNGVMDKNGDHALTCACGGDRTKRHNQLRNCVYHHAASSGLHPELERPGLLQPRPYQGTTPENGVVPSDPQARRPADVNIPRWRRGTPMALDFAVTSGLRNVSASIQDRTSPVTSY